MTDQQNDLNFKVELIDPNDQTPRPQPNRLNEEDLNENMN